MSQTVGWAAIMYRVMDSNGIEKQPGYHSSPYTSIFFIVYIIIGAFFITALIFRDAEKNGHLWVKRVPVPDNTKNKCVWDLEREG